MRHGGPLRILTRSEGKPDKDHMALRNKIPKPPAAILFSLTAEFCFFFSQCVEWEQGMLCQPLPGLKRDAHYALLVLGLANAFHDKMLKAHWLCSVHWLSAGGKTESKLLQTGPDGCSGILGTREAGPGRVL